MGKFGKEEIVKIKNVYMDVWKLFKNLVEDYMFTLCNYWRIEGKEVFFKMFSFQVQNI